MHHKDRSHYQYALLNTAILQADFGCYGEAIDAMHETIAAARENKDMGCLNFSLSWLYHFRNTHPAETDQRGSRTVLGNNKESLAFLKARAKEGKMWSIYSSTLLNEAKYHLATVSRLVGASARDFVDRIVCLGLDSAPSVGISLSSILYKLLLQRKKCNGRAAPCTIVNLRTTW